MSILSRLKRKKCAICKGVIKPKHKVNQMNINSNHGMITIDICNKCGDFWDENADIIKGIIRK